MISLKITDTLEHGPLFLGAIALGLAATHCAAAPDGDGTGGQPGAYDEDMELPENTEEQAEETADSPELGVQQQAFDTSWVEGPFTWSQGQSHAPLRPVSTHMCVLTKVSGDFDGGGEEVKIYQSGGYWYLGGKSMQSGVSGKAYCFAKNKFLAYGDARWSSGDEIWLWAQSGGCYGVQGDAWWGDATTMLNGISGKLRQAGDRAWVTQSSGPFTPSILRVETCGGFIRAYAHSFFVGAPSSGVLAKYWGGEATADSAQRCTIPGSLQGYGDHEVPLAPVNDAMCHFTRIGDGGDWDGGAEYVEIYPKYDPGGIERWYLRAHSGYCDNSRRTIARARCFKRDQR